MKNTGTCITTYKDSGYSLKLGNNLSRESGHQHQQGKENIVRSHIAFSEHQGRKYRFARHSSYELLDIAVKESTFNCGTNALSLLEG